MLNATSGKNGFRGFASKLREQAKDVVGNVKLPSFDDMAKNDDYIHSPDFNVRAKQQRTQNDETEHHSATNSGNGTTDEASNYSYSTESSWSLLDRSSNTAIDLVAGGKTPSAALITPVASNKQTQNIKTFDIEASASRQSNEIFSTPNNRQTSSISSGTLLSVVSDALQPTTPVQTNILDRYPSHSDVDSDQSSQDFDEEDPILSVLRKDSYKDDDKQRKKEISEKAPASVITIQKSSNRFMDDVRLQAPVNEDQSLDGIIKVHQTDTNNAETTEKVPFGAGFFKNTTMQNFKRIVMRKGPDTTPPQTKRPPLAREQAKKTQKEDGFQIKAATSVGMLGNDDLEQLKQLKLAGQSSSAFSSVSNFIEYLRQHRHFLFVAFTFVLSIYVYFRKL